MGYRTGDLERREGVGAGGRDGHLGGQDAGDGGRCWTRRASFASRPLFLPNISHALSGRADFFRAFEITFDELGQAFTLTTVDP